MCEGKKEINEKLKKSLEREGVKLLRSDNIEIGGRIPLPNGSVGIVCEEARLCKKQVSARELKTKEDCKNGKSKRCF